MSRSQLYAEAVAEYVSHHRDDRVTEKLNEVYSAIRAEVDPVLHEIQSRTLEPEEW